jgi:hypothetical protein
LKPNVNARCLILTRVQQLMAVKRVSMSNVKTGLAFVCGWFLCGLMTPRFTPPRDFDGGPSLNAFANASVRWVDSCTKIMINESSPQHELSNMESDMATVQQKSSSRCELLEPSFGCLRPPFMQFGTIIFPIVCTQKSLSKSKMQIILITIQGLYSIFQIIAVWRI